MSWLETTKTNNSISSEVNESKKTLGTIGVRKWTMTGYFLRHANESVYIMMKGRISGIRETENNPEHNILK